MNTFASSSVVGALLAAVWLLLDYPYGLLTFTVLALLPKYRTSGLR